MATLIGVIGGGQVPPAIAAKAEAVGRELAHAGAMLVCGGLGGVMEAACRGARANGGTTIGILPGTETAAANRFVSVPIATGLGIARNVLIVRTAAACIAIDGSYGTLSEIALALNCQTPVIALDSWDLPAAGTVDHSLYLPAETPHEAVAMALRLAGNSRNRRDARDGRDDRTGQ